MRKHPLHRTYYSAALFILNCYGRGNQDEKTARRMNPHPQFVFKRIIVKCAWIRTHFKIDLPHVVHENPYYQNKLQSRRFSINISLYRPGREIFTKKSKKLLALCRILYEIFRQNK